jgi:hypothetical protein
MQNENSLYEMPADRMVFTHEGLGEGRELGEVEVVSTIWGKARVRVVNKQGMSGWAWLFAASAVLGVAAMAWLLLAGKETDSSEPRLLAPPPVNSTQPTAPTASIQDAPVQNIPSTQAAPTPPVPATVAAPEPAKSAQPGAEKPQPSAEKHPVAEKQIKRDSPTDTPAPAKASIAGKPGKTPATASPSPAGSATPHMQAKQPIAGKAGDSPAPPANPATTPNADPVKADPSGNAQPAKPEPSAKPESSVKTTPPVKADMTDSRP